MGLHRAAPLTILLFFGQCLVQLYQLRYTLTLGHVPDGETVSLPMKAQLWFRGAFCVNIDKLVVMFFCSLF